VRSRRGASAGTGGRDCCGLKPLRRPLRVVICLRLHCKPKRSNTLFILQILKQQ
jgi:hypothetical protein